MLEMEEINWRTFLKQGDQYYKAATPKGEKSKFNNDTRYNLLSMSLEGFIMAILDFHQNLPDNHTYTDLIFGLERVIGIDKSLKERILRYESLQSICSIDKYHRVPPTDEDLKDLYGAVTKIKDIAHSECHETAAN